MAFPSRTAFAVTTSGGPATATLEASISVTPFIRHWARTASIPLRDVRFTLMPKWVRWNCQKIETGYVIVLPCFGPRETRSRGWVQADLQEQRGDSILFSMRRSLPVDNSAFLTGKAFAYWGRG